MKNVTLLFCSFLIGLSAFGQSDTTYWATKGDFSIQFNQASFSNWATGGDNSYSGVVGLDYSFDFTKDKLSWENNLILSYGLQSLAKDTRKTEDKIDFSSKYGYKLSDKAYFGALFSVKSQFTNGYNYPNKTDFISRFGAPLYVSIGPGIDYKYNEFLSLFISPASIQWVIINDDYLAAKGVFGNDPGEKIRTQFGASVKMHFNKEIAKNIKLDTKLALFSDYLNNPQNIIVSWDMAIDMKVNSLISAKITTGLIYDNDIVIMDGAGNPLGPRVQFKEMFGAGLSFKF